MSRRRRRIACDCGIVAVAGSDPAGMTVGRCTRSIPPAIRRALVVRDRGCSFPGCTHTRFLHGHHWRHWLHGGEASLANLLLLCPRHHRLVHEGGWSVKRDEEGRRGRWDGSPPDYDDAVSALLAAG